MAENIGGRTFVVGRSGGSTNNVSVTDFSVSQVYNFVKNIEFDFKFSKTSLNSSLHHQSNFEGTYADYAKMLSCLDGIIKNAELVEIHPNYKGNEMLKQTYVLVGAFKDGNAITPVQLEVKEQYDNYNGLYLNVVLGQIKKEPAVVGRTIGANAVNDFSLITGSTISLSQLFANVNTGDNKFLKYIPDKFLSEEQITAKRAAQEADYTKYGRYKEIFEGKPEQKFSLSDPLEETEYDKAITVTDVSTLRSIGRKSVSEFTSEDIEKSKKWAHKFYKELGTKSPFFRAWFGDWRVYDTAEYEPVDIRLNTVYKAGKEVNNDTGKVISWGNTLLSETKNHAKRSNVAPGMLGNISDIIKNAVLLDTTISIPTSNKKMANTAFMHTFYSAATVDGNIWIMRLFAEEALPNKGGDSFTRAYELKEIEKIGEIAEGVHLDKESLTQAKPPISLHNISDLYGFVKQYDPNFNPVAVSPALLNSDGTPKVVYHGTNADFTVFDLSKSGQTAPGISDGFFFFTDKKINYPNSASDYANSTSRKGGTPKVYEVYLSIKNPLYIDSKGYYDNIAYFDTHSDEIYSTYFSGDYDGVIISNSDKSADDSTLYLLDNASAIKSATDNIGTFDGSNPDIRYSLEDTSSIDYPSLLKENTDLKKQNEALAAEMKLTEGHKVSRGAVEKLAGKILREYKSGYDKTVLADNLEKVFNYIADENADAAQAMDVLSSVAKAVIEQSSEVDYSLSEQFSPELDAISSTAFYISPSLKSDLAATYGSYKDFVNSVKGRIRTTQNPANGTAVDTVWSELTDLAPGIFDEETYSPLDMMIKLEEFVSMCRPQPVNPYEMNTDEAAADLAATLFNEYFDTPEVHTFADKQQAKLTAAINESRMKQREIREQAKKRYTERLAEAKKAERERYDRKISDLRSKAEQAGDEQKQLYLDRIDKLRRQKNAKLAEQKARYMDMRTAERERRAITAEKAKIRKIVDDFNKRLLAPTDNRYVPKDLFKTIVDVCSAIDLTTGKLDKNGEETKATRTLFELKAKYEALKSSPDYAYQSAYNAVLSAQLSELSELTKDKRLSDLNLSELTRLHDILKAISKTTKEAVSIIRQGERISVYESGERVIKELSSAKGAQHKFSNQFMLQTMSAERAARYLTGYAEDSELVKLVKSLTDGEVKQHQILMDGTLMFSHLIESKENQKLLRDLAGQGKDSLIDVEITDEKGEPVKLTITKGMRASMYMHSLNGQNRRHIAYGGFTVPDIKLYLKGKYTEAYNHGNNYRISEEQLLEIVSGMTDYEKQWCDTAYRFFNEFSKKLINETSEQLNGYRKAEVENYYPISSDRSFTNSNFEALVRDATIEGAGFLKKRVYGSNPIYLEDIVNVVQRQLNNVAKYAGLAVPVRNFTKVYNMTAKGYTTSVKQTLKSKYNEDGAKLIENLLTDLQSGRSIKNSEWDRVFDKIKSNMAQATLSANLSVTIKQAASYPTAAAVLGWKPLAKALAIGGRNNWFLSAADRKLLEKYSPELWFRNQGNSTKELGDISKNKGFVKGVMDRGAMSYIFNTIQKMDVATVGRLWYACQYKVDEVSPQLEKGTDAYYKEVAHWFNDVIHETQPNYSVMQRPDILRSPSKMLNIITTYKTQSLQNLGIMADAMGYYKAKAQDYNAKLKAFKADGSEQNKAALAESKRLLNEAGRKLALAASSQIVAAAVFSSMGLLAAAFYHRMNPWRDDEDELTLGTIMAKLGMGTLETLAGSVPSGAELFQLIQSAVTHDTYYEVEHIALSAVTDIFSGVQRLLFNITNCFDNSLTTKEKTDKLTDSVCYLAKVTAEALGIPYNNLKKTVMGIWKHYEDIANGEFGSFKSDIELTDKERLFAAKIAGDTAEYDRIYGQYKAAGKSKGEIDAILAAQLKDTDKRIGELAYAFGHDVKRYEELVAELKGEGWDWDVISRAMNKYTAEMKTTLTKAAALRAEGDTTSGNYKQLMLKCMEYQQAGFEDSEMERAIDDYTADLEAAEQKTEDSFADSGYKSIYSKSQLYTAIKDADSSTAQKIYADLLKEKTESLEAQGYTAEEAEKKAKSSLKSSLTAEFKQYIHDEHISSGKDLNATGTLRTMLVKYFGYTYGEVNKWLNE